MTLFLITKSFFDIARFLARSRLPGEHLPEKISSCASINPLGGVPVFSL